MDFGLHVLEIRLDRQRLIIFVDLKSRRGDLESINCSQQIREIGAAKKYFLENLLGIADKKYGL
jgi:hypothetical protein